MRNNRWLGMILGLSAATALALPGSLPPVQIQFASAAEGRRLLQTRDSFIQRLSPFDRAARLKTDREVSVPEFLRFVSSQVLSWQKEDRSKVQASLDRIRPALAELSLGWPEVIHLIKTTGAEEGDAAYTRGNAIVLPEARVGVTSEKLSRLLAHELFHILSRHDEALRDRLYSAIGFEQGPEIELPAELKNRRITNPDAPRNQHWIRLRYGPEEFRAVPVLFSKSDRYDPQEGGTFFKYLQFRLLLHAASDDDSGSSSPGTAVPKLVKVKDVSGFFEQVGRNSSYIIHPEEILAENFALIVMGETEFPSPEVANKIRAVLGGAGQRPK